MAVWVRAPRTNLHERALEAFKQWGVEDLDIVDYDGVYEIYQVEPYDQEDLKNAALGGLNELARLLDETAEQGVIIVTDGFPLDPYDVRCALVKPRSKALTLLKELMFKSTRYYWTWPRSSI